MVSLTGRFFRTHDHQSPAKTRSRWAFHFYCRFLTRINPFEFVEHEAGPTTPRKALKELWTAAAVVVNTHATTRDDAGDNNRVALR